MLRRIGFWFMAAAAVLTGAFIIGETVSDPGGWQAAWLIAAWVVPLAGLAALSWLRPGWAMYVLGALTAIAIAASIWVAISPGPWRSFENQHGPVRAIVTFVLAAAIAVLGLRRTAAAGFLLLALGILPAVVSITGRPGGGASLLAVSAAPVITGLFYLAAGVGAHGGNSAVRRHSVAHH